jgi:hypothetical protein
VHAQSDSGPLPPRQSTDLLPRWRGGCVLYPDFDGVLHPENVWRRPGRGFHVASPPGHRLFEHAAVLARCLAPYHELPIVPSTNWVRALRSVRKASTACRRGLRRRVVGATFHGGMHPFWFRSLLRGEQVCGYVSRRERAAWLTLDDDERGWPDAGRDQPVQPDPAPGIGAPSVLDEPQAKLVAMRGEEKGWR